ncbi:ORF23 [Ranid herpesvirus 1]|uniref:ORF23 n=1 Tax=Ranid herpesvirus 1 TaxID=85655 RepID=Q14VT5_9VIRU|nr:ORF23 [Ranid herpesvirus 1]ABG25787.1 ORF23 [Ranid herpesvirus 1]
MQAPAGTMGTCLSDDEALLIRAHWGHKGIHNHRRIDTCYADALCGVWIAAARTPQHCIGVAEPLLTLHELGEFETSTLAYMRAVYLTRSDRHKICFTPQWLLNAPHLMCVRDCAGLRQMGHALSAALLARNIATRHRQVGTLQTRSALFLAHQLYARELGVNDGVCLPPLPLINSFETYESEPRPSQPMYNLYIETFGSTPCVTIGARWAAELLNSLTWGPTHPRDNCKPGQSFEV